MEQLDIRHFMLTEVQRVYRTLLARQELTVQVALVAQGCLPPIVEQGQGVVEAYYLLPSVGREVLALHRLLGIAQQLVGVTVLVAVAVGLLLVVPPVDLQLLRGEAGVVGLSAAVAVGQGHQRGQPQ